MKAKKPTKRKKLQKNSGKKKIKIVKKATKASVKKIPQVKKPSKAKPKIPKTPPKKQQKKPQHKPLKKQPPKKQPAKKQKPSLKPPVIIAQPEEKKVIKPYPVLPGGQNERISMLLPILRDFVRKGTISDWIINLHHNRSANLYVERNFVIEDELSAIREDVLVTIYERFPDGTMGEAQLPVIATDPAIAKEQILEAKATCSYARKKAFTLPEPVEGIQFPQSHDEKMLNVFFNGNSMQVAHDLYSRIKGVMLPILDVRVNAFEILCEAGTVRVLNSNGVDVSYHRTSVYLEIVLSCKGKTEEREFVLSRMAASPEQLDIQGLLLHQAQIARDATNAQPNPGFTGDIFLSGNSITEFFAPHHDVNPLVLHTFAKLETMKISCLKIGQPIGHFIGEPITIASSPTIPLGLQSAPVDSDGTPLQPTELIRNGVFARYLAPARYAQYLGVPASGALANVQVSPGATREQNLRGNNYFEIVAFSWFNPNPFSGDFSAEIRLGYHWLNGRKIPFRGGTFTGNVFKNILNARFTKEVMQSGAYYGPRGVMFKNAVVNKFE